MTPQNCSTNNSRYLYKELKLFPRFWEIEDYCFPIENSEGFEEAQKPVHACGVL
jgi:hypothetical protein